MCGIAGVYLRQGALAGPEIVRVLERLRHRGPDDEGYLFLESRSGRAESRVGPDTAPGIVGPRVGGALAFPADLVLGHRRLSIIDLSPAGHQPMASKNGTCWIVHNGEIYNYLELRQELERLGHHFSTRTDTEAILAAYQEWGLDCLDRFNGMWAFALWDGSARHLLLARDRLGVKPLYYVDDGRRLAFASEPKALLPLLPAVRPNLPVVHDYLAGVGIDHTAETFFEGVQALPAGHILLSTAQGVTLRRWWRLVASPDSLTEMWDPEAPGRLVAVLEDAVRLRLRLDVPVGSCLSGGLDSSSIVCLATRLLQKEGVVDPRLVGERFRTFSACFEDRRFDEREYMAEVVAATGVEANQVLPDSHELWATLPRLVWQQDEPFSTTSIFAQWAVMEQARACGVTVLLDGQGSDELLAGYEVYFANFLADLIRERRIGALLGWLSGAGALGFPAPAIAARSFAYALPAWAQQGVRWLHTHVADAHRGPAIRALAPALRTQFAERRRAALAELVRVSQHLHSALVHDLLVARLPQLLRYEDRNSMAFSLEARLPFLDYRLVEMVLALPAAYKVRDGWSKWVLREGMKGVLPERVRCRLDKKGFVTPEVPWLSAARPRIRTLFRKGALSAEFLDLKEVLARLDGLLGPGRETETSVVWRWVNLEVWLQKFCGADVLPFKLSP